MKTSIPIAVVCTAVAATGASASAAEVTLESAPPVVVATWPCAGAQNVDPAATEIKPTFSKEKRDGTWSWTTWGEENVPENRGKIRYLSDRRTCVLPVKLTPGKFYAIWLNSESHATFEDTNGQPALPYLLIFETRP